VTFLVDMENMKYKSVYPKPNFKIICDTVDWGQGKLRLSLL